MAVAAVTVAGTVMRLLGLAADRLDQGEHHDASHQEQTETREHRHDRLHQAKAADGLTSVGILSTRRPA